MLEFGPKENLEAFLKSKPGEWAQIISARIALRVAPVGLDVSYRFPELMSRFALNIFRLTTIAWSEIASPARSVTNTDKVALRQASDIANAPFPFNADNYSVFSAIAAVTATWSGSPSDQALQAGNFADRAARGIELDILADRFWSAAYADYELLRSKRDKPNLAQAMKLQSLWLGPPPPYWTESWQVARSRLLNMESSFDVWTDWFDRRIRGEEAAFDITGDTGRKEDKAILARLADAKDEDFWDKGAHHVNTTLQGWIDEARARAIPLPAPNDAAIPPQNPHAVMFKAGDTGRIAIDDAALSESVRSDDAAQDRHAEAVAEASALLAACQGSNAGARMTRLLDNYLAAAGETLDSIRPSLFVQRGERLRQELAAYANPDNDLPPLTSAMLADFRGWQSAHNMVVGLDPALMAMDMAQAGPDAVPAPIPPDEVRMIARSADADGLLEDGVREIVEEAANNAPNPPVPGDRRTVWSTETARNLVIEAFAVALNHPEKSSSTIAIGTASVATFGAVATVAYGSGAIGAAWATACFLMKYRGWIESRLGDSPTWRALFLDLTNWIEKNTPIKPGKDN